MTYLCLRAEIEAYHRMIKCLYVSLSLYIYMLLVNKDITLTKEIKLSYYRQ